MPNAYEEERFIGFVDVLGYKSIVRDAPFNDSQRYHYLTSIFNALASSAQDVVKDLGGPPRLRAVQFSDSFYFSSSSAITLVTALSQFFANVFTLYDLTFNSASPTLPIGSYPEWLPFLRGGIVHGWFFEGLDITLPQLQVENEVFRNPIGPAVANAYLLSEATHIEGMRLAVTAKVRACFEKELPLVAEPTVQLMASQLHPLFLKTHPDFPDFGDIYEVPWFESRLMTNNTVGTFDTLIAAKRQFSPSAMKHYRGTWDAILRTPGVQANSTLLARATAIRHEVVQSMAYENWERRGSPYGDSWFDWFTAEGRAEPR